MCTEGWPTLNGKIKILNLKKLFPLVSTDFRSGPDKGKLGPFVRGRHYSYFNGFISAT